MWIRLDDEDVVRLGKVLNAAIEKKVTPVGPTEKLRDDFRTAIENNLSDMAMNRLWSGMPFGASIAMGPAKDGSDLEYRLTALAERLREHSDHHNTVVRELDAFRRQREMIRDFLGTTDRGNP